MVFAWIKALRKRPDANGPWLSQRIIASEKVLADLAKSIDEIERERSTPYDGGTRQHVRAKLFLPSAWLYGNCILVAAFLIMGLLLRGGSGTEDALRSTIPIQITIVILSLAIPVVSTYGGVRARDELATSYLWHVTRFARFTQCVGAAVLLNTVGWVMGGGWGRASVFGFVSCLTVRVLGLGLTLGAVLGLVAILLEVIAVASSSGFATGAGARHHALGLLGGMLRQCYVNTFMRAHQHGLDEATGPMRSISGPEASLSTAALD